MFIRGHIPFGLPIFAPNFSTQFDKLKKNEFYIFNKIIKNV